MSKPKKVLIVCYYWPPAGGPGVQRWLKFVKYLPEFDIEPIVYVPENPSYPIVDEHISQEIPKGVTIIKRPINEPYRVASMLSRKQTKDISAGILPSQKKQSFIQKALLYIRGNFFIPDARVGWVKPSITFLSQYIKTASIDTVITSGPPHSMHLIGLGLKNENTNLRWTADFRDPWTTIGYHDKLRMTLKTQETHKKMELEVLESADQILVTSPKTKEDFHQLCNTPIEVITNGYDIEINVNSILNDNFTIGHIGSLLSDRNPKILWKIISTIISRNSDFKDSFKLVLAGKISEEVIKSIKEYGLDSYLELKGYISHKDAIILQRSSNILLLIEIDSHETQSIIPGKVFEYLAARKPIIAIGPENSDIKSILEETEAGSYHTYQDEKTIKNAILTHFDLFQKGQERLTTGDISKYHRKALTKQLSDLILR